MTLAVSCVLFDLDNTLTDRAASIRQFSRRFLEDFRPQLADGTTFEAVHQVMHLGDGGGYRPKETMFAEIQRDLHWISPPSLETIAGYWYRVSAQSMQLRPDVRQTLDALRARGLAMGIITNGKTEVQNATIDAVSLRDDFSVIVISQASGFRKPDPQIFQLALSVLNQLPEQAVYVGDHPQSDVEGARAAGLQAVWFAGIHPWPDNLKPPEYQITEIFQLLDFIAER